jgi:hypothetical protein
MMPIRTTAPRTTHSQISPEPDPLPDAGELLGWAAGAGAVALWAADGWAVAVGGTLTLGEKLALLLGRLMLLLGEKLPIAPPPPLCPHPAARNPSESTAASRTGLFVNRCMPDPSFDVSEEKPLARTFSKDPLAELPRLHPLRGSFAPLRIDDLEDPG